MSEQEEFVRKLGAALEWEDGELGPESTLRGHDHWDSLGKLNTMALIEDDYGKTIEAKALESVETVGDLQRLVFGGR